MSELLHQFILIQAQRKPEATALKHKDLEFSYAELEQRVVYAAQGLRGLGLQAGDRVATYLPKLPEMVFTVFGASAAGGVFVPINPLLKPAQVVSCTPQATGVLGLRPKSSQTPRALPVTWRYRSGFDMRISHNW